MKGKVINKSHESESYGIQTSRHWVLPESSISNCFSKYIQLRVCHFLDKYENDHQNQVWSFLEENVIGKMLTNFQEQAMIFKIQQKPMNRPVQSQYSLKMKKNHSENSTRDEWQGNLQNLP